MAKFNENHVCVEKIKENEMVMIGFYLMSLISEDELECLKFDWRESGGLDNMPLYKFAIENIRVEY